MNKIPFNPSFFHYALIGLLGRMGNNHTTASNDGYYIYTYAPSNENEMLAFEKNVPVIKTWIDMFDITFSETRVAYGEEKDTKWYGTKVLIIQIGYNIKKEEDFWVDLLNTCIK